MTVMTPHEVLGIPVGASPDEVKRAFREKIKAWHPDLHGGSREAEEKTREIIRAYEQICRPRPISGFGDEPAPLPDHEWFFSLVSVVVEAFGAWAGVRAARSEEPEDFVSELFGEWRERDARKKSGVDGMMEEILS